jgi:hypothetical protein
MPAKNFMHFASLKRLRHRGSCRKSRSLSETKRGRQAGEHKGAGNGLSSLPAANRRVRHDQAVGQSLKLLKI